MWIILRVMSILIVIAACVVAYYLILWVLGLLGISVPERILTAVLVLIGLVAVYHALSGGIDRWWPPRA